MKRITDIIYPAFAALALACFAVSPRAQAVSPAPDGCYPGFTTAEGCNALNSLTTGAGNTAFGWRSLFVTTTGSYNTAVGAGTLVLNTASSNTAVGAAALLLNTTGGSNTAIGTDALVHNDSGSSNTATGYFALFNNTNGGSNTANGFQALTANVGGVNNVALGTLPLSSNTTGNNNTAIGNLALESSVTTNGHVCVGRQAGESITSVDNNIILGHHNGVHSVFGQQANVCYIDNIHGAPVSAATAALVIVDSDGRLGTVTMERAAPGGFSPKGIKPQDIPDAAKQAMLNLKVQTLEATVAELRGQLKEQAAQFTALLKAQAEQIQKVSAQLEISKPAPQTVLNNP